VTIRIVLADDHAMFASAVARLLTDENDFDVVGTASDSDAALDLIRRQKPDVALLDIRMPPDGGLVVARHVREERLPSRIVILTAGISDHEAALAMEIGVAGLLLKDMSPAQLVRCIRKVHAGEQWVEMKSTSKAITKLIARETSTRDLRFVLTPREFEVLEIAAAGLSTHAIAEKLRIGEGTVKMHLHAIYEKLGLKGRVELMAFAHKHGLGE